VWRANKHLQVRVEPFGALSAFQYPEGEQHNHRIGAEVTAGDAFIGSARSDRELGHVLIAWHVPRLSALNHFGGQLLHFVDSLRRPRFGLPVLSRTAPELPTGMVGQCDDRTAIFPALVTWRM
jgi:hypothetical protein